MTLSIRTVVKISVFALACLLGMFLLEAVAYRIGIAQADNGSAVIAAGSGSDNGSAIAATPAVQPPALHDPTVDPMGYLGDLAAAKKLGWPALALLLAVGLLEGLSYLGKSVSALAWLGRGRWSLLIGGGVAILLAACNAAFAGGSYMAIGSAALFSLLAYWHLAGTNPVKA